MKRYDEYKDTGIEWIPQIPKHWEVVRTKFVIKNQTKGNGITKLEVFEDGDTPCVRYGEIYSKYNHSFDKCFSYTKKEILSCLRYFEKGDILVACTGELVEEIGKNIVYMGEQPCLAGGDIIILKPNQNSLYLNYVLNSKNSQEQKSYGKTKLKVVHISSSEIGNIFIPLPPLSEQEKIVEYLEHKTQKIDAYVAERERELQLLSELKEAEVANVVTRGINPNAKMKDSGIPWIGMIPEHWEVRRLSSLFVGDIDINSDFKYQYAFKFNYGSLVLKNEVGDIEEYRTTYEKYSILKQNDIVINGLNLNYDFVSQRVAQAPSDGIITSAYIVLRPRVGTNSNYCTYLFKSMDNKKIFHGMGKGIRLTLSFEELKKQFIPLPPLEEQQAIVAYIEEKCKKIDALVEALEAEIEQLKEYKQSLIADCVTGKIKV